MENTITTTAAQGAAKRNNPIKHFISALNAKRRKAVLSLTTGLFRRKGSTKTMCCLWGKTLTFLRQTSFVSPTHTPLALFYV